MAIASVFISCEKTRNKGQIQGKIENEQIAVVSKIPGKIVQIFVKEGDLVKKGDALFVVQNETSKLNAENAQLSADFANTMRLIACTLLGLLTTALPSYSATLVSRTTARSIDANSCTLPKPVTSFSVTDQRFYFWFLANNTSAGDRRTPLHRPRYCRQGSPPRS